MLLTTNPDPTRVFVVHGRNEKLRRSLFSFLRAIHLKPIEWNEAIHLTGKGTPFIGEILNAAFDYAQAVVVLMTPDDEARLKDEFLSSEDKDYEKHPTGQARPNVLFEAGMALSKDADRTILVEIGALRPFSDVAGRHTIKLDNTAEKRLALAQRLKAAGCPVSMEGIDWLKEGDFSAPAERKDAAHQKPGRELPSERTDVEQGKALLDLAFSFGDGITSDQADHFPEWFQDIPESVVIEDILETDRSITSTEEWTLIVIFTVGKPLTRRSFLDHIKGKTPLQNAPTLVDAILSALVKRGFLSAFEVGGEILYTLTDKGERLVLQRLGRA